MTASCVVKLGTIRPPISMIRMTIAATAGADRANSATPEQMRLDMKPDIGEHKHRNRNKNLEIAPILAGDDFARGGQDDQAQETRNPRC